MFFKVDRNSGKPVFEQIKSKIKDMIMSGKLSQGDLLPSVRNLANILGVNVNTVARAYRELELEGVVEGRWGYGYTVKDKPDYERWLREKREEFERMVRNFIEAGLSIEILEKWLRNAGRGEDA